MHTIVDIAQSLLGLSAPPENLSFAQIATRATTETRFEFRLEKSGPVSGAAKFCAREVTSDAASNDDASPNGDEDSSHRRHSPSGDFANSAPNDCTQGELARLGW